MEPEKHIFKLDFNVILLKFYVIVGIFLKVGLLTEYPEFLSYVTRAQALSCRILKKQVSTQYCFVQGYAGGKLQV